MIIVSACLAGICCRYDCQSKERKEVKDLVAGGNAIPVCPEQLGGLPTPRPAAEILNGKVLTHFGEDISHQYCKGAEEAIKLVKMIKAEKAILKSKSPMCGYGKIYSGDFSGNLIEGNGVFAERLIQLGLDIDSID